MDELEKTLEQLGRAFEEFKTLNDKRLSEVEKKGSAPGDLIEKTEKANSEIARLETEVKALQTAINRPGQGAANAQVEIDAKSAAYSKAFKSFMRTGNETEVKTLSVDSDADGGFLVTPEVSSEIVKKVFESSPMRELASVQSISSDALEILEDLDEMASGWVTETQSRPATGTAKLKKINIPTHELYAAPLITQKLLDDAALNIEAWLSSKVSEKFGRDEATAFISGDGSGKPKGILSYGTGDGFGLLEQVNSGAATNVAGDGLINLQSSLKEPYQANATWLMRRTTVAEVRKLKDSQGRYIWQPGLTAGAPSMILDKPVKMAADMPAVGAGNLSVAYGDFRAGYQIVDRVGIRVLRDPFTAKPFIMFYTTKRVGGGVKNFEALKLGKCSA